MAVARKSGAHRKFPRAWTDLCGCGKSSKLNLILFDHRIVANTLPPPEHVASARITKMSDGEVEVEAVSGYQVLPKDVLAEVGSIKLFSTSAWQ